MGNVISLTNKSTRVFSTTRGSFRPGTTKEFDEKEAVRLLGYTGEIKRTIEVLGADSQKVVEQEVAAKVAKKNKEIENLKGFISKLTTEVESLRKQLKAAKPRGPRK